MTAPTTPVPDAGSPADHLDPADRLDQLEALLTGVLAELAVQRAERERRAELVHELTPIAQAAMGLASQELAEAQRRGWLDVARRGASAGARLADAVRLLDWPERPPSTFALVRSLRDPRARLGLARAISLLHVLGTDEPPTPPPAGPSPVARPDLPED